jgi:hypothetical protein
MSAEYIMMFFYSVGMEVFTRLRCCVVLETHGNCGMFSFIKRETEITIIYETETGNYDQCFLYDLVILLVI